MKEILNYHEPLTGKLLRSYFSVNEKEFSELKKVYGQPYNLMADFPDVKPSPFRITGEGWAFILPNGYVKNQMILRKATLKVENYEKN